MKPIVFICSLITGICFSSAYAEHAMILKSKDFQEIGIIPVQFTCKGERDNKDKIPSFSWQGAPKHTKSFALTLVDPDAPNRHWVHWVAYNIPGSATELTKVSVYTTGINSEDKESYQGPCPPEGKEHRYIFTLYAFDLPPNLPHEMTESQLMLQASGHILASAEYVGTFESSPWFKLDN